MRKDTSVWNIDWLTVILFFVLIIFGWLNIYASEYSLSGSGSLLDLSTRAGKQFVWICISILIAMGIFLLDQKFFDSFAYIIYGIVLLLLVLILLVGKEISGAKSWFALWGLGIQPSEFAKMATAFAIAKFVDNYSGRRFFHFKKYLVCIGIFSLPMLLIVMQGDTGTAMIFGAFILVLYREGMSSIPLVALFGILVILFLSLFVNQVLLIVGVSVVTLFAIGFTIKRPKNIAWILIIASIIFGIIKSIDFIFNDILKPYQKKRLLALVNPNIDPLGIGWNVTQSKIAIGSGGFWGKGFLNGTQTKFNFVPEQSTDFIFCTIGEEHGWIGSTFIVLLFGMFFFRLIFLAERQKSKFSRVYGYSVIAILFAHFIINIAMTMGLFPVVGIPLPFFSYGGSSLFGFSILLFVFLKLDSYRLQLLQR